MKAREVRKVFVGKLGFTCDDRGGRHTDYVPRLRGRSLPLPIRHRNPRHSRGSGDLKPSQVGKLAAYAGLREAAFEHAGQCHVDAACCGVCFAAKMLREAVLSYSYDPPARDYTALVEALRDIVTAAADSRTEWNEHEAVALQKAVENAEVARGTLAQLKGLPGATTRMRSLAAAIRDIAGT